MKKLIQKLKYQLKSLKWLKSLNSPFKPFRLKFYCGKLAIGTPYFFPRKWVKGTPKLAHKATLERMEEDKKWNELNPKYARKLRSYDEIYKDKINYRYAVPRKIGFDLVGLGYKTKWSDTDYRFEWAPLISFVFFKWQIVVSFIAPEQTMYWACWLYYENNTDKRLPKWLRIEQCRVEYPCTWVRYEGNTKVEIDYYKTILKPKYLK